MDAMFTPLSYGMTGRQVRDTLNANSLALETYSLKESISDNIESGITYEKFIYKVNYKFSRPANAMSLDSAEYDLLTEETEDIVSVINANYDIVLGATTAFWNDPNPYWFDIKQAKIPNKGNANILAQNGLWKFAYFTGETILYISADGGETWPYTKDFATISAYSLDNIKLAQIFNNGDVFFAIKQNKIFASYNLLTTIVEETMMDLDGVTPMVFHTPMNVMYPGMYFGTWLTDDFQILNDEEVFVWSNYAPHVAYGATPVNIYYKKHSTDNPRIIYKFGQNSFGRDNGGPSGYTTADEVGNLLGNPNNPVKCIHLHSITQRVPNGELWATTGDWSIYNEVYFLKLVHNSEDDSWAITEYDMNSESQPFRICDLRFFNNGNNVIYGSDQSNKIYKVTYENLTSTNLANHILKHTTSLNIIRMSSYGEYMLACCMTSTPFILVSTDYGETWDEVGLNYITPVGATGYVTAVKNPDSSGFYLLHNSATINTFDARKSFLIKPHKKVV